jgi:hypothetical protein
MPKLTPHVAAGGNFIDGVFHVDAPVQNGLDRTRLWTRGGTFFRKRRRQLLSHKAGGDYGGCVLHSSVGPAKPHRAANE